DRWSGSALPVNQTRFVNSYGGRTMKATPRLSLALCMLALALTAFGKQADQRLITFNIEPQPLSEALSEWAQQANLQLISPASEVMDRLRAPRVTGALTAEAALRALLAETPLVFEFVNERTVAIRKRVSDRQT